MNKDIIDFDKLINVNGLVEVTNPIHFNKDRIPTEDGLFSHEIFGPPGSFRRKQTPAIIDLGALFIHPHVFRELCVLKRDFTDMFAGRGWFKFNETNKQFEKEPLDEMKTYPDNYGTGVAFFVKYWDKFEWKKAKSKKMQNKQAMTKIIGKDIFVRHWLVMPAHYRDISYDDSTIGPINKFYKKLITNSMSLKHSAMDLESASNMIHATIQNTLVELHEYLQGVSVGYHSTGKGMVQTKVLGKNIDYGIRTLISAPTKDSNTVKDSLTSFTHTAVPLSMCITGFLPFIQGWVRSWATNIVNNRPSIYCYNPTTKENSLIELDPDWESDFTGDGVTKMIEMFNGSKSHRFDPVTIKCADNIYRPFALIDETDKINSDGTVKILKEPRIFTLTDLFYQSAMDVCSDKHVQLTRYPILNHTTTYSSQVNVRGTVNSKKFTYNGVEYSRYPVIDLSLKDWEIESQFVDSTEVSQMYLPQLDADFDGDQIHIRSLLSKQANAAAARAIRSKLNAVSLDNRMFKHPGQVTEHVMYNLMYRNDDTFTKAKPKDFVR